MILMTERKAGRSFKFLWKKDNLVHQIIGCKDGVINGWLLTYTSTSESQKELKVMSAKDEDTALAYAQAFVPGVRC